MTQGTSHSKVFIDKDLRIDRLSSISQENLRCSRAVIKKLTRFQHNAGDGNRALFLVPLFTHNPSCSQGGHTCCEGYNGYST